MSKIFATAALIAVAATGVSAANLVVSTCVDGGCITGCKKSVVTPTTCAATNSTNSLTAVAGDENVGLWFMDTYANSDCTGPSVRVSGLCNACSNGMNAMCGGLPGALMIRYNCGHLDNDACGNCADTIKLPFGGCQLIPNYKPKYNGYVYALVNWGCITAGSTAQVQDYSSSATCSGKPFTYSAPIGLCNLGQLIEVRNSTVNLK